MNEMSLTKDGKVLKLYISNVYNSSEKTIVRERILAYTVGEFIDKVTEKYKNSNLHLDNVDDFAIGPIISFIEEDKALGQEKVQTSIENFKSSEQQFIYNLKLAKDRFVKKESLKKRLDRVIFDIEKELAFQAASIKL